MKKLVIDRARWSAGKYKTQHYNKLVTASGKMCCLGFYGEQIVGLTQDAMRGWGMPDMCPAWRTSLPFENEAVDYNDGIDDNAYRERCLTELFAEHDVEVTFEGEYPEC